MEPEHGDPIYESDGHSYEDVDYVIEDLGCGEYIVMTTGCTRMRVIDHRDGWTEI